MCHLASQRPSVRWHLLIDADLSNGLGQDWGPSVFFSPPLHPKLKPNFTDSCCLTS